MGVWGLASLCGLTVREILGPSHPGGAPNIRLAAGVRDGSSLEFRDKPPRLIGACEEHR